jgi:hypothetical protein
MQLSSRGRGCSTPHAGGLDRSGPGRQGAFLSGRRAEVHAVARSDDRLLWRCGPLSLIHVADGRVTPRRFTSGCVYPVGGSDSPSGVRPDDLGGDHVSMAAVLHAGDRDAATADLVRRAPGSRTLDAELVTRPPHASRPAARSGLADSPTLIL